MSYQEKKMIVNIISTILIFGIYSMYVYNMHQAGEIDLVNDLSQWGVFFLILIPISIVANVIIEIVFNIINHITNEEKDPSLCDERDKLILMKGMRNSYIIFIFGFLLSMVAIAMDYPVHIMFLVLFGFGFVSSIVGDITQFYFYRRGF
jgi:hypothetical protein